MALLGKASKKKRAGNRPRPAKTPWSSSAGHLRPMPRATPSDESRRMALLCAEAGLDKKASGVDILDVTGKVDYADYLVLMTGQSDRHVSAIARAVEEIMARHGNHAVSIEGLPAAQWVLLDFVDVVVHVFLQESRALYDLDGLWLDARRIPTAKAALGDPKSGA